MVDHFFWVSECQGMAFGNTLDANAYTFYKGNSISTIFDTGTSHLLVPQSYLEAIIANVVAQAGNP